jgi:hypothetical protein
MGRYAETGLGLGAGELARMVLLELVLQLDGWGEGVIADGSDVLRTAGGAYVRMRSGRRTVSAANLLDQSVIEEFEMVMLRERTWRGTFRCECLDLDVESFYRRFARPAVQREIAPEIRGLWRFGAKLVTAPPTVTAYESTP